MRVYYFALVACAATLTSSTNSSETSSPTMTKIELLADVRSTHGGHDGVAAIQLPDVHDPTTEEERMMRNAYSTIDKIANAIQELVGILHPTALITDGISSARQSMSFDHAAILHYVTTRLGDPKIRLRWLRKAILAASENTPMRDRLVEEARVLYREYHGHPRVAASFQELSEAKPHPVEVLKMLIPAYVGDSTSASMVYEELVRYIEKYNEKSATTRVTIFPTLYEGFDDVTKIASFLSEAMLEFIRAQPVERMDLFMSKYRKNLIATIDHMAVVLGLSSTQIENTSVHHSLDTLAEYISKIMDLLPSSHQDISTHLTMKFGDRGAAMLMERARGVNPS